MDKEDEEYIDGQIKEFEKEYLNEVIDDCKKILHEAIMDTIFSTPEGMYRRTEQLENLDNITFKFEIGGTILIYIKEDLEYYSFGRGKGYDNSKLKQIPADLLYHILEVGHDIVSPYKGDADRFHHYPAQHFLEEAQQRMKEKYPDLDFEIIRDQPELI
jgi:hypothetical protein